MELLCPPICVHQSALRWFNMVNQLGSVVNGDAERVGFEPTEHINSVHRISSAAHSASSDTSPKQLINNLHFNEIYTESIESIDKGSIFFNHMQ